jgi:hypothetical protein
MSLTSAADDGGDHLVAELTAVVLLGVLRTGTLALGAEETANRSAFAHPAVVIAVLFALGAVSTLVFARAGWRLRQRTQPVFDDRVVLVEAVAGAVALFVVAYATHPGGRPTSAFWVEPYTVISAVVIAAAASRASIGAAAVAGLTAAYLIAVLGLSHGDKPLPAAHQADAWANALSYLPFYAIAAVGFAVLRSVVGQTEALRRALGRLSAERARIAAATSAYRIGHDIPKALLREIRRDALPAERLRPWAAKYRDDLLAAISGDARRPVDLKAELTALAAAFGSAIALEVELEDLDRTPSGTPALLIVEAARELLNNASYHAFGYPATLAAQSSGKQFQVTVRNGGPGVDPDTLASTWARKHNTVHQLDAAGGEYEINSSPGLRDGTTVTLRWPADATTRGRSAPGASGSGPSGC